MLSDILPTGFDCGVLNGKVVPGSSVAIVGAGPIEGSATLLTAQFYSPAAIIMIDLDDNRLEVSRRFGPTHAINSGVRRRGGGAEVMAITEGRRRGPRHRGGQRAGHHFSLRQDLVAPGGVIANVGVHGSRGRPAPRKSLVDATSPITTPAEVDTAATPMLLKTVHVEEVDPRPAHHPHRFGLAGHSRRL